jgi:hypothetical protein
MGWLRVPCEKARVFGVLFALAGCVGTAPMERQVVVSEPGFPRVSEADLGIRAFAVDAAGRRREVIGAHCDVASELYSIRLTTLARLVVPNLGSRSPMLRFDCRADGLRGEAESAITTRWRTHPFGYGAYGWEGPSYPVSAYANVSVLLR